MKFRHSLTVALLVGALWSGWASRANAQASPPESKVAGLDEIKNQADLDKAITALDTKLFDAYNHCDLVKLGSMVADDLEFYHDKDGLSNYAQTRESLAKLFAGTPDIRRELVKGSLAVYPIKGLGAVEIGEHVFCHKENGKDDCGTFKFVMIWRQEGGSWKISRVISFDH